MKAEVISPREGLIERVGAELQGGGRDYSGTLVVFPGRRPGHFLRRNLALRMGGSFMPPAIFSMDDFIDHVYEEILHQPGRKLETIDAVALLYEIQRASGKGVGGEGFLTLDAFFSLALKLYDDLEECRIEMVDADRLRQVDLLVEALPPSSRERLHSFSFFYEEFYRVAKERGLSTRSERYRTVAATLTEGPFLPYDRMLLCGFFALTSCERAIFRSMMAWERVSLLFQAGPGIEKALGELGLDIPTLPSTPPPATHIYKSPDRHGQVFAAAALLKEDIDRGFTPDEQTVVVLPAADTLFPLLHHTLSLLEPKGYNISLGYPLERSPVFTLLANLMELVLSMDDDRLYMPHYLSVVLHPYVKNLYFGKRADVSRMLFHGLEERLRSETGKNFMTLHEIEGDGEIYRGALEALSGEANADEETLRDFLRGIHRAIIIPFLHVENVGDFARKSGQVILYIAQNSTARLHPFFQPFMEALLDQLALLERSLLRDMSFAEKSTYLTFFKRFIRTCYTPFEGTPLHGLQVLGFLETRNLAFRRVIFLDANEEVLPAGGRDDPFLPVKARKALGLPTYRERDGIAAYYFDTLVQGSDEVHLFFVEKDGQEKSRFVEKLLWERQKREGVMDGSRYVRTIQYAVRLDNKRPPAVAKTGDVVRFLNTFAYSARSLDTYLACPLQFYYRYVLGLSERSTLSGEIERDVIGILVHRILFEYFKERIDRPLISEALDTAEMKILAERLFGEVFGADLSGAAYLAQRQCATRMTEFLLRYQIPVAKREEITILALESPVTADIEGFRLTGRLDRVEKRGEQIVIMDYKTGGNTNGLRFRLKVLDPEKRETWSRALAGLQLPLYLLLYAHRQGREVDGMMNAAYVLLGRAHMDETVELPFFESDDDPLVKFEASRKIVFALLREIVDPRMPFVATPETGRYCPTCDFQYLCGTQWMGERP